MSLSDRFPWALEGYKPAWNDAPVEDDLDEVVRRSLLDGLQKFDHRASLPLFVDIRLSGPRVESGALDFAHSALLKRFNQELEAVLPPGERENARLSVVGVSTGSVVLHARPNYVGVQGTDELAIAQVTPLESALTKVLDLHDDLEGGTDSSVLSKRKDLLLDRLRQLIAELDEVDVELEVRMSSSTGKNRSSKITEQGRRRAAKVFARREVGTNQVVSGLVQTASLDGVVILRNVQWHSKRSRKRTVEVRGVPSKSLSSGSVPLGGRVTLAVHEKTLTDSVGTQQESTYKYMELLAVADAISSSDELA